MQIFNSQIPQLGKIYNCFDDGKISPSRLYKVRVKEIIPFHKIDTETLDMWKDFISEHNYLFAKETDYFIKTYNGESQEIFVRTVNGKWFSIGSTLDCGLLDLTGELTKSLIYFELKGEN